MKVYAFDVDHTLEVSDGPISMASVRALRAEGHITGLCGNWALVTMMVPDWQNQISFLGPLSMTKAEFLKQIATYVRAEDYVMVGNDGTTPGHSRDSEAARLAGWRFLSEARFAGGER